MRVDHRGLCAGGGTVVRVETEVDNFRLVDANIAPQHGEGHLHFFVNQPADTVPVGQAMEYFIHK